MANKQKILIVDDDENIAQLISLYLTKECFETRIVYDGESALQEMNSFSPDLILLDLMLPGIDGYQVCREVRQKSQIPIIMLSAKGEVFDKVLGLELGADDYLEKPFDTNIFISPDLVKELFSCIYMVWRCCEKVQQFKFFWRHFHRVAIVYHRVIGKIDCKVGVCDLFGIGCRR